MMRDPMNRPKWGLLPEDIVGLLRRREWENTQRLKLRLKGKKPFPIEIGLKPPRGNSVLENMDHFQKFVAAWTTASSAFGVCWEKRNFRYISTQKIPVKLSLKDVNALAQILGTDHVKTLTDWQVKISFLLSSLISEKRLLFDVLIDHLEQLSQYQLNDLALLVKLIPQLQKDMGNAHYLRALPVTKVDTKFIENNLKIIESLVDAYNGGTVKPVGLLTWLGCKKKPKDWLLVRPLCDETKAALGGLPLLRLSTETLLEYELPASRILITENEQSCLALPSVPNTVSVSGGGKNVSWLRAAWLSSKKVAYWGDIDSEGFSILSDVKDKLNSVVSLMMDETTVVTFQDRMVAGSGSVICEPATLSQEELRLFRNLSSGKYGKTRLEQERISLDYVQDAINAWLKH